MVKAVKIGNRTVGPGFPALIILQKLGLILTMIMK